MTSLQEGETDDQTFALASMKIHERYNDNTYENDIAILKLSGAAKRFFCHSSCVFTLAIKLHIHFDGYISHLIFARHRSESVWPICLPPPTEDFTNRRAFVIGERVRWK